MQTDQIMSDVWEDNRYATVWDDAKQMIQKVRIRDNDKFVCDLSPENFDKVFGFLLNMRINEMLNAHARDVATPVVGKTVKIVSGRIEKNKIGKIFKIISRPYQTGYKSDTRNKLGVAFDDEMIDYISSSGKTYKNYKNCAWVWGHNVQVIPDDTMKPDLENIQQQAFEVTQHEIKKMMER